jgi:phosphoglycolate phosphatase
VIDTDERLSTQNEWIDNDEVFSMKNSYGAVFDLDGVLLDSESDLTWLYTALEKTLEHLGIESSEENLMKIHSKNVHKFNAMSIELSVEAEDLWETRNREYIEEKIRAMKNGMIKPFSDVGCLYELKGKYRLSIVSNSPQEIVDFFIEEFNYEDLFDYGIGRGTSLVDLKKIKPNSHLLERLKERIQGKKLIYIGDSENDRKFAKNTGMEFMFLSREGAKREEFDTLDKIVKCLLKSATTKTEKSN